MLYVAFLLFLLLLRHLRLKVRQLHLLLPSQPLPLRQRLQQRNPGGSNLSRVGPRRVCILLFLQLLRLRLELHQLRLLLLSQRPLLLQLHNPGGSSLSRLVMLRVIFLLFPLRTRVLRCCLLRRREHPTPTITRTPGNSPNSSGRVHLPPRNPAGTLASAGFPRHRPNARLTLRTRHHSRQPRPPTLTPPPETTRPQHPLPIHTHPRVAVPRPDTRQTHHTSPTATHRPDTIHPPTTRPEQPPSRATPPRTFLLNPLRPRSHPLTPHLHTEPPHPARTGFGRIPHQRAHQRPRVTEPAPSV